MDFNLKLEHAFNQVDIENFVIEEGLDDLYRGIASALYALPLSLSRMVVQTVRGVTSAVASAMSEEDAKIKARKAAWELGKALASGAALGAAAIAPGPGTILAYLISPAFLEQWRANYQSMQGTGEFFDSAWNEWKATIKKIIAG